MCRQAWRSGLSGQIWFATTQQREVTHELPDERLSSYVLYLTFIAASLIDYLTHVAFFVTAWHEHAGTVIQYFLPMTKNGDWAPSRGMGLGKVRSGKEEKSVQVNVGQVLDRMRQPFMNYRNFNTSSVPCISHFSFPLPSK